MFHAARITALAWSPDGKRLASGSLDGSVIVWDPWSSGAERITVKNAHPGGVTSLVWRDDARVCTGGFDACVRTWTV
jgi:WD40 repeat protein